LGFVALTLGVAGIFIKLDLFQLLFFKIELWARLFFDEWAAARGFESGFSVLSKKLGAA